MTQPSSSPSKGPLSLAPLADLSLGALSGSFPLSETQTVSLKKLGALWNIISHQTRELLRRNEHLLTRLRPEQRADLEARHPLFAAPWVSYREATTALRAVRCGDLEETRVLCNGLHELATLATLLASYGTPSFILRAYAQALTVADPSHSPHAHLKRLYKHPITVHALNHQLSAIGGSPISLPTLPTGEAASQALDRLTRECHHVEHAHSKEEELVKRLNAALQASSSSSSRLIIITSPTETNLLASRLRVKAPAGFADCVTELSDSSTAQVDGNSRVIVCSPRHAHRAATEAPATVVVYSPLFIDGIKLVGLSTATITELRALFPKSELSLLSTTSELFTLDETINRPHLSIPIARPQEVSSTPTAVTSAVPPLPAPQKALPKKGSITVDIPSPKERLLFDQATLDALGPPKPVTQPLKTLPSIDPSTLPKDVPQLNARLGISSIRDALILREDQIQELFRMLAANSFDWLYKSPTGSGKTAFASLAIAIRLGNSPLTPESCRKGSRVAYVTPNVDLCPQAKDEFIRFINVKSEEIAILNGKTTLTQRRALIADDSNTILVGTPGTLRTTLTNAPKGRGYDSLAFMIIDEFQTAEGEHEMARIIREASAANVSVLVLSGTPVRDAEDLAEKRELLPQLQGALVPQIPQPLKNHSMLSSRVTPQMFALIEELGHFSLVPYIDAREQLLNGRSLFNQAEGLETKTLFDNRQKLKRKPHIVSFSPPTADRLSELKSELELLRADIKAALQRRRDAGIPEGPLLRKASVEAANASLNLGRMGSINASLAPLSSGGRFPFLFDFTESWFPHILESTRAGGNLPLYQNFIKSPDYRGAIRQIAVGTPFHHLLQARSGREALESAFNLTEPHLPQNPKDRQALFLHLATREMSRRPDPEHEKEQRLFEHLEERLASKEARGILIFAEPRYLTRYLALRLHHRFHARGVNVAFVTGEGDGFAADLANSLEALHADPMSPLSKYTSPFATIRATFEAPTDGPGRRTDIIVATSRLAVGHNLSAASEAHLYTMHADAQRLLQTIGRAGRPKGDNFFGRVGQCYYHVTQNTFERYLFLSAIRKYTWMRNSLSSSESWQEIPPADSH